MLRLFASILVGACVFLSSGPSRSADVDLALVVAVDVSGSITAERWVLQRQGYARAFASSDVIGAIGGGRIGAIAVTFVEWSSVDMQGQAVGWMRIDGADAAREFADRVATAPRLFAGSTSISGAIDYAVALLDAFEGAADRRVIDLSGDGANNSGRPAAQARDRATTRGITVNGLPIQADEQGIVDYYRDNVIGGPGAFLVPAADFGAFADAILNKLVREISFDLGPGRATGTTDLAAR